MQQQMILNELLNRQVPNVWNFSMEERIMCLADTTRRNTSCRVAFRLEMRHFLVTFGLN